MRCLKSKIVSLIFLIIFITGCNQTGVTSPDFDGSFSDGVLNLIDKERKTDVIESTNEQKRLEGEGVAVEKVDDLKNQAAQESQENILIDENEEKGESVGNHENEEPLSVRDTDEVILVAMKEKYKLYNKAWRISEREENETPIEYFQRYAQKAVSNGLLQEGIDFFTGPPRGYSSSKTETLIEAEVRSRIIDQAVIASTWEEVTIGDGLFTKDVYDITIKMKKDEQEWIITDLHFELISQEELTDDDFM